ncbi:PREDICTED: PR domain zinc finger protein 4-like, partial [Nestor notabilis]|uniref:PR domain zinc finger protein 4-like n=1 Tax=Nestor notabilis TaxID=176057 RepID=UPI0005232269
MESGGPGREREEGDGGRGRLGEGAPSVGLIFHGFSLKSLPRRCQLAKQSSITAASPTLRDNSCLPSSSQYTVFKSFGNSHALKLAADQVSAKLQRPPAVERCDDESMRALALFRERTASLIQRLLRNKRNTGFVETAVRTMAHVIKGVSLLCVSFQNATGIQNESGVTHLFVYIMHNCVIERLLVEKNTTEATVTVETLDDVPEHVLRGLPEDVRLFPSAVDKTRLGVWATKSILKGKKFGPFVGDKKKRSQVKSNVYMWEVYYPNLGWMCVDATDPEKGNWLRYINWARSGKEQNLFPLEINRTIYYKSLK